MEALALDVDVIVVVHVVDADDVDVGVVTKEALHEVATDEACGTSHEDSLAGKGDVVCKHGMKGEREPRARVKDSGGEERPRGKDRGTEPGEARPLVER